MAERELKLNSLGRYGKDSPHLILEEYGHCEIPAGCGGVLLRWRSPNTGLQFVIRLWTAGKSQLFLNGQSPSSGVVLVPFGSHVFSIIISDISSTGALLGFSAVHDQSQPDLPRVSRASGRRVAILSDHAGGWRYSLSEPTGDAWMSPSFDDSEWPALAVCESPALNQKEMPFYRLKGVLETGALCVGATHADSVSRIWVRKCFTLAESG